MAIMTVAFALCGKVYEKREALITIGIHRKGDNWYINESTVR